MKKLKLNLLSQYALSEKEMHRVNGGTVECCSCGCNYENNQGSTSSDNANANKSGGLRSSNKEAYLMWCPGIGWSWVTP